MEGQHLGAIAVSGELMQSLFFTGMPPDRWFRVDGGLPADAEYVRCYEDLPHNRFVFVYRHPSFPLTRPGEIVPLLPEPRLTALHGVRIDANTGQVVVESLHPQGVRVVATREEFEQDSLAITLPGGVCANLIHPPQEMDYIPPTSGEGEPTPHIVGG
jgi:hypothetical protein